MTERKRLRIVIAEDDALAHVTAHSKMAADWAQFVSAGGDGELKACKGCGQTVPVVSLNHFDAGPKSLEFCHVCTIFA